MRIIAITIYGPPGSGKGTQADLLAKKLNALHFDIGAYLEAVVHDPHNKKNRFIQEQRRIFDTGGICDSLWVAKLAAGRIRSIRRAGMSLVLSGSLRTLAEAVGNRSAAGNGAREGLLSVLTKEYGKENLFFFVLKVKPQFSLARNRKRLVCSVCGKPVLMKFVRGTPKGCPVCGGKLRRRTLDAPSVIRKRLIRYREETVPVFTELKRRGYMVRAIDGEPPPFAVHQKMLKALPSL